MRKIFNLTTEKPILGLENFFEEFLATRIEELSEIENALKVNDYKIIAEFAHKWKGFSAPYGFGILGQLGEEIERCLEEKDFENCRVLLKEAEVYLRVTKKKDIK
ncbi:MAG: Hpt domain-containing protein [Bacteriovorax sp.]|nr:Hpt domain-containing protein [Bacteriovorax sp.]